MKGLLKIKELRDYATVYLNGKRISILDRHFKQDSLQLETDQPNSVLGILVENNGRINYGPYLTDNRQGITEKVTLDGKELTGWIMFKFPFSNMNGLTFTAAKSTVKTGRYTTALSADGPAVYKGIFNLVKTGDTYLDLRNFGKGFVFLNGHNLGKYWYIGPQQTIYVPAVWLRKGINEIEVFDELKANHHTISTLDHPILDEVVKMP